MDTWTEYYRNHRSFHTYYQ